MQSVILEGPPDLDFAGHDTLYATHGLHAYAAKCPPQLAHFGISRYSSPGDLALDPVCGSGTTLIEAQLLGRSATGFDLDPLACLIACVKSSKASDQEIGEQAQIITERVEQDLSDLKTGNVPEEVRQRAVPPDFPRRDYWFKAPVAQALALLSFHINGTIMAPHVKEFLWLAFSSVILSKVSVANARDIIHSRHQYFEHAVAPDVVSRFRTRVKIMRKQLSSFQDMCTMEAVASTKEVHQGDARHLPILNEFETGYPNLTLLHLIDVATFFLDHLSKGDHEPFVPAFKQDVAKKIVQGRVATVQTNNEISWKALLGKLWRLNRAAVFDNSKAALILFSDLIRPGRTTVVDLSDTDSTIINNLVISNILRGPQLEQEEAYTEAEQEGKAPTPLMIIIEEAHEFLSRDRIAKMQNLFEQVARIARRGRQRWIGLMFVTQLSQHLPDEVLGLINNYILHTITDVNVVSRLKRSIGGIDEGLWNRLPNLEPGQAIVSMASMSWPLLVAINPTPCKLRMID